MIKKAKNKLISMFFLAPILLFGLACSPPGRPISDGGGEPWQISLKIGAKNAGVDFDNADGSLDARDVMVGILEQGDLLVDLGPGRFKRIINDFTFSIDISPNQIKDFHPGPATLVMIISDPVTGHLVHIVTAPINFVE